MTNDDKWNTNFYVKIENIIHIGYMSFCEFQ